MTASYFTLESEASAQIEVKRSRFVAYLAPVGDEAAARAVIAGRQRLLRDARHHCTAFVLGPNAAVRRSNDDGEPSGTAGAPMLEVLAGACGGHGVTDVVAVVTRWFGGVLLGTGGLARAYADAVRGALDQACLKRFTMHQVYAVTADHAGAAKLDNVVRLLGAAVIGADYAASGVTLTVAVSPEDGLRLTAACQEATAGMATVVAIGEQWV